MNARAEPDAGSLAAGLRQSGGDRVMAIKAVVGSSGSVVAVVGSHKHDHMPKAFLQGSVPGESESANQPGGGAAQGIGTCQGGRQVLGPATERHRGGPHRNAKVALACVAVSPVFMTMTATLCLGKVTS